MESRITLTKPMADHLDKVKVLLTKASDDYGFNVKCASSNLGYSELIALDTSSYEGKTLKKAAIDILDVPNAHERQHLLASITAYYQLVQARANEGGKISKKDMQEVINSLYSEARMAA